VCKWEAQLAMLAAGKKCWARSVKKWLFKIQPHEVAILLPVQPSLKMAPQPTMVRALQVEEPTVAHVLQVKEPTTARVL
jgi:hypothetical protein